MWHFSHFVSLFSSPVALLGYTLMTAQQFQFHSALNLRYLSWDVAGNHSSPLLHVPSLKLNLLKEMHFWEKITRVHVNFVACRWFYLFCFFVDIKAETWLEISHHSSSSFYVQFKLNLLRAARFREKMTRVHANFVALHVIFFFLSKLNQLRHLRGHAPKKRPRLKIKIGRFFSSK